MTVVISSNGEVVSEGGRAYADVAHRGCGVSGRLL
jgi:hypothetical protein